MHEDAGDVSVMRSPGLDTARVALPAGIDLDDRAARMNEFWRALVDFQYRDVLVVALCVGEGATFDYVAIQIDRRDRRTDNVAAPAASALVAPT